MRNKSSLRVEASNCLKKNGLFSIIIFFFTGLLIGAISLINVAVPDLIFLLVPLMMLPIVFAFSCAVIILREESTLTFTLISRSFRKYFNERFRSAFSVLSTALRVLIAYLIVGVVVSIIVNLSFFYTDFMDFKNFVSTLFSSATTEEASEFVNRYKDLILIERICTFVPTCTIVSIYAFYRLSLSSISMFLRFSMFKGSGLYISTLFKRFLRKNYWSVFKDYFALNYPMYILLLLGFGGGITLGYIYMKNADMMYSFGLALALFLSFSIYGAKYFANKEAIYKKYLPKILEVDKEIKAEFVNSLRQRFGDNLPDELKEEFEEKEDNHDEES